MASWWLREFNESGKVWAVIVWTPYGDGRQLADKKYLKAPLNVIFKEFGESALVLNVVKVIKRVDAILAKRHGKAADA